MESLVLAFLTLAEGAPQRIPMLGLMCINHFTQDSSKSNPVPPWRLAPTASGLHDDMWPLIPNSRQMHAESCPSHGHPSAQQVASLYRLVVQYRLFVVASGLHVGLLLRSDEERVRREAHALWSKPFKDFALFPCLILFYFQ